MRIELPEWGERTSEERREMFREGHAHSVRGRYMTIVALVELEESRGFLDLGYRSVQEFARKEGGWSMASGELPVVDRQEVEGTLAGGCCAAGWVAVLEQGAARGFRGHRSDRGGMATEGDDHDHRSARTPCAVGAGADRPPRESASSLDPAAAVPQVPGAAQGAAGAKGAATPG